MVYLFKFCYKQTSTSLLSAVPIQFFEEYRLKSNDSDKRLEKVMCGKEESFEAVAQDVCQE